MATIDELRKVRLQKLEALKAAGILAYPETTKRDHTVLRAIEEFSELVKSEKEIILAGRIKSLRGHGGVTFFDIEDGSASLNAGGTSKIQVFLKKDGVGEKSYQFFLDNFDIGDFIEVRGILFETKAGEKTLKMADYKMLSKSLRPLPEKWHGVQDIELRLRQRYLDLIMSPEEREIFRKKAVFWKSIREFLDNAGFMEVDTAALEPIAGGADANPFKTHHDALDEDFYLRISLELPLKKFIIGGFEKVYEIGKVFRNEGIDAEHLQDYLALEFYWAYADYKALMKFTEEMYKYVIKKTMGTMETECKGNKIDWGKEWQRIDYFEIFKKKTGLDLDEVNEKSLADFAKKIGLSATAKMGKGRLIDLIYKKEVRPALIEPCFLINPPAQLVPLAKKDSDNPEKVRRMQPIACGTELGNGYSELNDPLDQAERFKEQMVLREAGDKEAQMMDDDFVEALEYGMPPTAGFGLSERLFAVLMDKPIRETVFQPPMKKLK
jgi:lysyl-tRNA synthetase, class II